MRVDKNNLTLKFSDHTNVGQKQAIAGALIVMELSFRGSVGYQNVQLMMKNRKNQKMRQMSLRIGFIMMKWKIYWRIILLMVKFLKEFII